MKTQKVEDLKEDPIVGKFYYVNCALIQWTSNEEYREWLPLIGPKHKDKQFSFDVEHYHYDGRFIAQNKLYSVDANKDGRTNAILWADERYPVRLKIIEIKYRRLKCRRTTTGLIPPSFEDVNFNQVQRTNKYWKWVESMEGKSCEGKKCPHFGTNMIEKDGILTCPIHKLMADAKTKKILSFEQHYKIVQAEKSEHDIKRNH